jgi:hypothetical protein
MAKKLNKIVGTDALIAKARAEAIARAKAGTPLVCHAFKHGGTVRYTGPGGGVLCVDCAFPVAFHKRNRRVA